MISRIDHVSLAVNDYDKAVHFFQNILGAIPGAGADDNYLKFFWQIFSLGDLSRLEIIKPTGKGSFLDNFLRDKKNGGVHHISLETPDIYLAKAHLEKNNIPYFGFAEYGDFWKELFIHPKDAFGVLIQIAQFNPDDFIAGTQKFPKGKKWQLSGVRDKIEISFSHPGGGKMKISLDKDEAKNLIDEIKEFL